MASTFSSLKNELKKSPTGNTTTLSWPQFSYKWVYLSAFNCWFLKAISNASSTMRTVAKSRCPLPMHFQWFKWDTIWGLRSWLICASNSLFQGKWIMYFVIISSDSYAERYKLMLFCAEVILSTSFIRDYVYFILGEQISTHIMYFV